MILRQHRRNRPQLTFTSDFHELVQGDLVPGPCVLRYDPLRLLPSRTPLSDHRIAAHLRLHPGASYWEHALVVPKGAPLADLADPTGQGFMLETEFVLPVGCTEIEAWFSCPHGDHAEWDSAFGRNYWLRFPLHDLDIEAAKITHAHESNASVSPASAAVDRLDLALTSVTEVDRLDVRFRFPSMPSVPRRTAALRLLGSGATSKRWASPESGLPIPHGAAVVFDLVYAVGEHEYTDDNQGRWYLAD
jgi:hypothetical protein